MRNSFSITLLLLFFTLTVVGQNNVREKIDSLNKVLPALKDSARIDCINDLSEAYRPIQTDTARAFALTALKEAKNITYLFGVAKAYRNLGIVEVILNANLPAAERYANLSLAFFLKTCKEREIALAWGLLGYSRWVMSQFAAAMDAFEKSEQILSKYSDTSNLISTYEYMCMASLEWGRYEKALQYAIRLQELTGMESGFVGSLYDIMGDHKTALEYARREPPEGKNWQFRYLRLGITFFKMRQYDSASHYYRLFSKWAETSNKGQLGKSYALWGQLHFALKHYDTALVYLSRALYMHQKATDRNQVMGVLAILSELYMEIGDYSHSKQNARELLRLANETGARQFSRDAHFVLYRLFRDLKKTDSAFNHLQHYTILKDSLDLDLSAKKLAFYRTRSEREQAKSKISLLNEERKLQQQLIKQAAQQTRFLISGLVVLLVVGFVLLRNILLKRKNEGSRRKLAENELRIQKLEHEREQARFQQQATELEMQALRAQMNPHFIFNSLNAINGFILNHEQEAASDYLTRFSRLIRMVLRNSENKSISLEDELETLRLYLHMESLRFKHSFHYEINCDNTVDAPSVFIPPLLLQPFAENAIWHGLTHKDGAGELIIHLHAEDDILYCKITDNGIGRAKAAILKGKLRETDKSMGVKMTKFRMDLLNQDMNGQGSLAIEDLKDESGNPKGTSVSLKIKFRETPE